MVSFDVVALSRIQFAATALYHFLFVPLTLGLSWIMVIMELCYLTTGKEVYKDMTKFWGKLFAINFAMGVTTGLTMEFEFGTNWAYYSRYVGDVFGTPLAVEGMVAFFLESSFVGLFFFGWDRLSKRAHWVCTLLVAIGTSLSALFILIANGWMNNPVGTIFDPNSMRMEMVSVFEVFFNPIGQLKFLHTILAGYMTGSAFVLGISSLYILRRKNRGFAVRSFAVAAIFGILTSIALILAGDESGYELGKIDKLKLALIEAEWHTEKPLAALTLFALPNQAAQRNDYAIKIPGLLTLLITRSLDTPVIGIVDLQKEMMHRVRSGITAYELLQQMHHEKEQQGMIQHDTLNAFAQVQKDLGFALLVRHYLPDLKDIRQVTDDQIRDVIVNKATPYAWPIFFSFRIMVLIGFSFVLICLLSCIALYRRKVSPQGPWKYLLLWAAIWIPAPWIACELGWTVAEYGRQPWTIFEALPTISSSSSLTFHQVAGSLFAFIIFYTFLFIIEISLMTKYVRLGPKVLGTGRYDGEKG